MAQFRVIKQEHLATINKMNNLKIDSLYVTIDDFNGFSTIVQYSSKYDNFKIISVKNESLDRSKEVM